MHDGAAVRLEQELPGATVGLVLPHGMVGALTGEVVLQLHGHHGDAVQEEHGVHRVVLVVGQRAVAQLPHQLEAVRLVARYGVRVLARRRLEEAQAELRARRHLDSAA